MYRFTATMHIDDQAGERKRRQAGDVITEADILPGCLESCLRTGALVPHEPEVQASAPVIEAEDLEENSGEVLVEDPAAGAEVPPAKPAKAKGGKKAAKAKGGKKGKPEAEEPVIGGDETNEPGDEDAGVKTE